MSLYSGVTSVSRSVPTYDDPAPAAPAQAPKDVEGYSKQVTEAYDKQGASGATAILAQAAQDPNLTADQRRDLLIKVQPVTDKIADDVGHDARRTDLPASGNVNQTRGIDDQQEYKVTVRDLTTALQSGDTPEANRVATHILSAMPAAPDNSKTDGLGLFGDALRLVGPTNPMLKDAIVAQLKLKDPQSAPPGSELALPTPRREDAAATLITPVSAPYNVPAGNDLPALRAYTDWSVQEANASRKIADDLGTPFNDPKKKEADPTGYEIYVARRTAADADQVRAEQALAAELRATYNGDPKNKGATEGAAKDLVTRVNANGKDPAVQPAVDRALATVLTETPLQRETNTRLYDVHRTDDQLNALTLDKQSGKPVSDADITAARDKFANARKAFFEAVGKEIDERQDHAPQRVVMQDDPRKWAANDIGARYAGDEEFQVALDADIILYQATTYHVGAEDQMRSLGNQMPASLDPTTRAYVMSDPRGQTIVDNYVSWSASQVKGAYDNAIKSYGDYKHSTDYQKILFDKTPPALAASQRLLELTDFTQRPYIKPDMVASIFNKLRTDQAGDTPSTLDRIVRDLSLDGEWGTVLLRKDDPSGSGNHVTYQAYNQTITNLSFAMDNMGRAQNVKTGDYSSPQIQTEIETLGRKFAEKISMLPAPMDMASSHPPPWPSRFDLAFKNAASQGSATLALETARQLTLPDAQFDRKPFDEWNPRDQANITLTYVRDGAKDYQHNTEDFYDKVNKNMAPVSSALARFGVTMTAEQQQAGVANIFATATNGEKLYDTMMADRRELDIKGYQLTHFGETVGFYEKKIGDLDEYRGVMDARADLMSSPAATNMIMLSNTATLAMGSKIAMTMVDPDHARGQLLPQKYGWIAQAADFSEYFAETYVLQKPVLPGQAVPPEYATWGDAPRRIHRFEMPADVAGIEKLYNAKSPTLIEQRPYNATRLGRFPLAGMAIWGAGGGAQVKLWEYIHNEVGFDNPDERWRKPFLEGLVGGFAAFHLTEAGAAAARVPASMWQSMKDSGWLTRLENNQPLIYQRFDTALDREAAWTRFSLTGTKGLTASLAGLMSVAAVWDISGVWYRAHDTSDPSQGIWGNKWWKVGTHAVNAASDVLLLRLQIQEYAKRFAPTIIEAAGTEAFVTKQAGKAAASRSVAAIAGRAFLSDNPIGLIVNAAYLVTTGVNWLVDQKRYVKNLENYDDAFLRGAGVDEMQADVLKKHAFWTGDGKGDGFALGYRAVGGDPTKFVEYLNKQKDRGKLEAAIDAAGELPDHMESGGGLQADDSRANYFLLPEGDPANADPVLFPALHYNEDKKRWEDSVTGLHYDSTVKGWRQYENSVAGAFGNWYDVGSQTEVMQSLQGPRVSVRYQPTGAEGWENYLRSHNMLPPGAPS